MGHKVCLKVSGHTKPRLRITHTWLNSLPGAGSGRNCFPSSAEWGIVPFPASSVSFYLGNSLTLTELNTSLVPLWNVTAPETGGNPALKLWQFLVFIGPTVSGKISCSGRKGDLVTQMGPSGTQFLWILMGASNGAYGLSLYFWMMAKHRLRHSPPATAWDFPQLSLNSSGNLNQVTEFWRQEILAS